MDWTGIRTSKKIDTNIRKTWNKRHKERMEQKKGSIHGEMRVEDTRLDFILVDENIQTKVTWCGIKPSIKTDHETVYMNLKIELENQRKGRWR